MRIISDFKDYYDCMQAYGYDPYIVYNRKSRPQLRKNSGNNNDSNYRTPGYGFSSENIWTYDTHSIGFCGVWYLRFDIFTYSKNGSENLVYQTYDISTIDKFVLMNFSKKHQDLYFGRKDKWKKYSTPKVFTKNMINSTIDKWKENTLRDNDELFLKYNTPIIICHDSKFTKDGKYVWTQTFDGSLKDAAFYKVMEPWQAYQELSMYMAGPLCTKYKPIPEIDDKTMAEAKGFDRYSFRKDKSK